MAVVSMVPFVSHEAGMMIPLMDMSCVSISGTKANNGPEHTIVASIKQSVDYFCLPFIKWCLGKCLPKSCFNFDHQVLTVHDGKGKKDRTVPLPWVIMDGLNRAVSEPP
jgi:hypothetical protein